MKISKKGLALTSTFLFVLTSGLLIFTFTGCRPRGFNGPGFHPGIHGKDFSQRFLERMDKKISKLELSDIQQEKYNGIRKKLETDLNEMEKNQKLFFHEMRDEINRENPDMDKVAEMVKTKLVKMPDRMGKNIDYFTEFYSILDEDQKGRVLKEIREKMNRHEI